MKKIQLLENNIINKIAAGEVVERPLSVVKELVENSIDAGASEITIEIKDGGLSLIRISDNGKGISKDEVSLAFLRHATSKIENMDDLANVMTLGFRGEALSSIASVSQVELITKTKDEQTGTRFEIHGEEIVTHQNVGSPEGTTIIVRNIFFNIPARRKFLKKPSVESAYISDIVNKFALGNSHVSFKYINNGTIILQTNGNDDLKVSILQVYGREIANKIFPVHDETDIITIQGYIGKPETARGNRKYENLFINGRLIKSNLISNAIEDAYKTKLPIGKFPIFILNIAIEPDKVDVNVHPTKLEVRFSNEEQIYNIVYDCINKTLKSENLIPQEKWSVDKKETFSSVAKTTPFISDKQDSINEYKNDNTAQNGSLVEIILETNEVYSPSFKEKNQDYIISNDYNSNKDRETKIHELEILNVKTQDIKKNNDTIKKDEFFKNYSIIGQIFNTYWIIEQSGTMFIIDQHAAHERILYEEIINKLKQSKITSQQLLNPAILNLSPLEIELLKDNFELIGNFGFEIEEFGNNVYALRALPYIFNQPENVNFFISILDNLQNKHVEIENIYEVKIDTIATISCKAAVKGNDKLSYQEAEQLIKDLLKIDSPFTCPHGRPTIIEMSKYELEKKFKRT